MFESSKLVKFTSTGNWAGVKRNIKKGGDPLVYVDSSHYGITCAFEQACKYNRLDMVKYFVEELKITLTRENSKVLSITAENNHLDVLRYLIEDGRIVNKLALHKALARSTQQDLTEDLSTFYYLLDELKVDPSIFDNQVLISLAYRNRFEALTHVLKNSAVDPSARDNRALLLATNHVSAECVDILVRDPRFNVEFSDDIKKISPKRNKILWNAVIRNVNDIQLESIKYIKDLRLASIVIESVPIEDRLEYLSGSKKLKRLSRADLNDLSKML